MNKMEQKRAQRASKKNEEKKESNSPNNNINWYPGHMKKTRELISENLKLVNVVVEVVDARIPMSSRNPIIDELVAGKKRVIALNKTDLSDVSRNKKWKEYFEFSGNIVVMMNSISGRGLDILNKELLRIQSEMNEGKVRKKPLRIMIVGVPNVGKSSLINRMVGKKSAKTGDRPGVTKGKQWITLDSGIQLLDTPGILWPKFEDPQVGLNLAFCGSIRDEILDIADLALELVAVLQDNYPQGLIERYNIGEIATTPIETMESIAAKRGYIMSGNRIDYDRCARAILDDFRSGRIGNITLEFTNCVNA